MRAVLACCLLAAAVAGGCVLLPTEAPPAPKPAEKPAAARPPAPRPARVYSAEQINERNAHQAAKALLDELDREAQQGLDPAAEPRPDQP